MQMMQINLHCSPFFESDREHLFAREWASDKGFQLKQEKSSSLIHLTPAINKGLLISMH